MAPLKKSKKTKKDSKKFKKIKHKNKKNKSIGIVAVENKGSSECDWWDSFWHKNSPTPGCGVPCDEEDGFKYFFRVSKKTFDYICSLVREDLISRPPSGLINIEGRLLSVEKQVAIALRRLASGESQVSVGASFGVGQSTVSQVTWRFIEALEERAKHHLKWPEPIQTSDDWCDQENNYSMLLQGIVDSEMRFLDIVTGWPGGMATSRLLKFSGFYKLCESGDRLNGNVKVVEGEELREYIIGGFGYPLLPWLITPYEGDDLSDAMLDFNALHETARSVAVKAFALLKGGWRILNKVMWRPDKQKLPSIILVCCLLHNIIIDCGDRLHPDVALSGHHDPGYEGQSCKQIESTGRLMRDKLTKHLQGISSPRKKRASSKSFASDHAEDKNGVQVQDLSECRRGYFMVLEYM
ncbi:protein ANTAGONIST OF LIKE HETEROCHROMATIN PROTEIN 1-like isoform X2 [Nicotiana tabacum]|uniref:Nuclease HARBI1 isoform X2 n=1 Tax=Nicotiana tabacum TaxID=4097 RepID=A0A1S4DKU8_TOBAC|nr:protein ANTAGONIST OF LIKE HETEROCHROMATIN PROTEIN 1 isoform X2 [Nicotiana tomentosiformis]XP_016514008.1 PREDICTED: putative nuclease HARBI1 isoform X2 [Nicotiana tabacum]